MSLEQRKLFRAMDNAVGPSGFARTKGTSVWSKNSELAEIKIELEKSRRIPFYYLNAEVNHLAFQNAWFRDRVSYVPVEIYQSLDLRTTLGSDLREQYLRDYFCRDLIPQLLPLTRVESAIVNWHASPIKRMGEYFSRLGLRGGWDNNMPTSSINPSRFRSFVFTKKDMDAQRYDTDAAYAATLDFKQNEIAVITRFVYGLYLELLDEDRRSTTYRQWLLQYFDTLLRNEEFTDLMTKLRARLTDINPDQIAGVAVWNSVCSMIGKTPPFDHPVDEQDGTTTV